VDSLYYLPPPLLNDYFIENSKLLLIYSIVSLLTLPIFIYFINLILSPLLIIYDLELILILAIIVINQFLKTLSVRCVKRFFFDTKTSLIFSASEILYVLNMFLICFIFYSLVFDMGFLQEFWHQILIYFVFIEIIARLIISTRILFIGVNENELRYYIEALLALFIIEFMFLIHAFIYLFACIRAMKILKNERTLREIREFVLRNCSKGKKIYFDDLLRKYPIYREILISLLLACSHNYLSLDY